MKKIYLLVLAAILSLSFASCSEDNPSGDSIFQNKAVKRDNFDKWLLDNYTYPYNIDFKYKMEDIYSDMKYHLVPADSAKSAKLAIIAKYLWFDAYAESVGSDFVKENVPRVIHLIGSAAYNSGDGTMVLGTAEGGLVITLYMVNRLTDATLRDYATLNEYYFHTHISEGNYVSGDWYQIQQGEANQRGFVTPYAMSEPIEDFAEMLSVYVTTSPSDWQALMRRAGSKGAPYIQAKLDIIRSYMKDSWKLDIDKLRSIVLRRASEINQLDLNKLN